MVMEQGIIIREMKKQDIIMAFGIKVKEVYIKDYGKMIKEMAKENYIIVIVIIIQAIF